MVTEDHAGRAFALAERRGAGEPLQYVTGVAGFRRLELNVGPGVFVPRPETELVAEHAMNRLPRGGTVVDVGTGSGAIALSIADERPDTRVIATELNEESLRWARRNIEELELRVELLPCDLLAGLPQELHAATDVIVSNPPYVAECERLPADILDHEPREALFAPDGGLHYIARIVNESALWLRSGGWLVLEIGESQSEGVGPLLADAGYEDVSISLDLAQRARIAEGRWPR